MPQLLLQKSRSSRRLRSTSSTEREVAVESTANRSPTPRCHARQSATSGCNLCGPRYAWRVDYRAIVTIDPGKRGGKPCIRGLRITVYDVLEYLASGMSEAEILADFPDLTADDIRACLAFAADRERRLLSVPAA
jgi:uncharacterized protein (DUF433 family)